MTNRARIHAVSFLAEGNAIIYRTDNSETLVPAQEVTALLRLEFRRQERDSILDQIVAKLVNRAMWWASQSDVHFCVSVAALWTAFALAAGAGCAVFIWLFVLGAEKLPDWLFWSAWAAYMLSAGGGLMLSLRSLGKK